MKKLFSVLFAVALAFSSLVLLTSAANLPIVPADAKATITIEKSTGQQGSGVLKVGQSEVNIPIGEYVKYTGSLNVYLENEVTGERKYLNPEELSYISSNTNTFTVKNNYLHGVATGSADLTVIYENQQITLKVNVVQEQVTLKFENTHQANYVNLYEFVYKHEHGYFNYMSVNSQFNAATGELKVSGIDWSQSGPYYALVTVGNYIYKLEIKQSDRNNVITIPYNAANFTKTNFELPQNSTFHTIQMSALNGGTEFVSTDIRPNLNDYYISNGDYAFVLMGGNGHSAYKGYINNAKFDGGEQKIAIPESQFSKSFITTDFKTPGAYLQSVNYCDYTVIERCYTGTAEGKEFYFSNGSYSSGAASFKVGNYTYRFNLKDTIFPTSDQIVLDDQLQAKLTFGDKVYAGGSRLYVANREDTEAHLIVKNKNGQTLENIRDDEYNYYYGKLIFKNGSEVYEVPLESSMVTLPNVSGTFEVTFTLDEGDTAPTKVRPDVSGTWKDWPNTKSVASNYAWTINLSAAANAATVTANNIFVVDEAGYLVEGVQVKTTGKQIFVSAPASGYEAGNYTLYIRDAVKNADGKALAKTKMAFEVK